MSTPSFAPIRPRSPSRHCCVGSNCPPSPATPTRSASEDVKTFARPRVRSVKKLFALTTRPRLRRHRGKLIRIGIIGLDTSHSVAFTQILNKPER